LTQLIAEPPVSSVGAGFVAFLALSLAAIVTARESAALGWPLVEVGALFALCGIGCVTALLLEFPALVRWLR
jgi:hypothetical protein